MELKWEARTLKVKAVCSLRQWVSAVNFHEEDGRQTAVLFELTSASTDIEVTFFTLRPPPL